jgi:hypothetical protein
MLPVEDIEITEYDKHIYNQYLITIRSTQNKPFKLRQNFKTLSQDKIVACKKIASKLLQYPNINVKDFFYAPFYDCKDQKIDLSFYASSRAISAYVRYMKHIESLDPDEEESLIRAKDSLIFIYNYCKQNKITVREYFTEKKDAQFTCLLHLRERKLWLYPLLSFDEFDKAIIDCDKDVIRLMHGDDFFDRINFARNRFIRSCRCKSLVFKIKNKLKMI